MKTQFTFRNGAVRTINEKAAKILHRAGKGTYMTRDLVATRDDDDERRSLEADAYIKAENARIISEHAAEKPPGDDVDPDGEIVNAGANDGLDALDRDALVALAEERGVAVHHRAGADKIRAALRGE